MHFNVQQNGSKKDRTAFKLNGKKKNVLVSIKRLKVNYKQQNKQTKTQHFQLFLFSVLVKVLGFVGWGRGWDGVRRGKATHDHGTGPGHLQN